MKSLNHSVIITVKKSAQVGMEEINEHTTKTGAGDPCSNTKHCSKAKQHLTALQAVRLRYWPIRSDNGVFMLLGLRLLGL